MPLQNEELTLGRIVVSLDAKTGHVMRGLRAIAALQPTGLSVATITPQGRPPSVETIPVALATRRLRVPIFEKGDAVSIHGKQAFVVRHSVNDIFVVVTFAHEVSKEVLTNLVHVDANDLLDSFDIDSTQIFVR